MTQWNVLVVEDDAALLRGLCDNLVDEGYEVRTAADGESGLAAAFSQEPDLLLLDVMLPKVNGYEICRQVRREYPNLPIIMLTAKGQEEEIVLGLELGADDYVTKPFSIRELLARVKALLRRHIHADQTSFRIGAAVLDLDSHKLTRDGVEVALTTKEYRMLEYFVRRPNRALPRNDIINHVWGRAVIVTSRSVDRCIATLRSKIEDDPRNPTFIHTIRDVGYRFELE
ncbi:MAG: response regulator transcription factor [Planctomycetales bacterium]|nr:response regulator transcription factor [Planctomycetales bacterium]